MPRNRYSKAVMVRICLFSAPRVRRRTLSFMRWYLLVRTEPIRTIIPVRILKNAMKLIIQDTLFRMTSTTVYICRKSVTDTLGNLLTRSRCNLAEMASVGALVVSTLNWGAFSKTPLGKTMVKLGCRLAQSTFRMLLMTVSIRTPWTLKTIESPSFTSASFARFSEMETWTISFGDRKSVV